MISKDNNRFAIISHVLPPMPSGQSMVLFKLLNELPMEKYCLLSINDLKDEKNHINAKNKLNARYFKLKYRKLKYLEKQLQIPIISGIYNYFREIIYRKKQILKVAKLQKISAIVCCSGNIIDMPAAYLAAKKTGLKLIPYLFDDFIFQWIGAKRLIAKMIEPAIIKYAHSIIVPNDFLMLEYVKRYKKECVIVRNPCYFDHHTKEQLIIKNFKRNYINIVYSGSIYHAHYDAFYRLLESIKLKPQYKLRIHIYTSQTKKELSDYGIEDKLIVYHDHISNQDIIKVLNQADILYLPLAFNSPIPEVIKTSAPGKMGEYLSTGKPILVHAPENCYISWFFRKHRCGIVVDKTNPLLLAEAIENLILDQELKTMLGYNAVKTAKRYFDIHSVRKKFLNCVNA